MDLNTFLSWLVGSGGAVMAASFICERWPWFQTLIPDAKEWLFYGITCALALTGYYGLEYLTPDIIAQITPIFQIVSGLFVMVIVGKIFHTQDKSK